MKATSIGSISSEVTWTNRIAALKWLPPLFVMLWETSPWLCLCSFCLRLISALSPWAALLIGRRIINDVVNIIMKRPVKPHDIWYMLGASFAVAIMSDILGRASELSDGLLRDLFTRKTDVLAIEHASSLDLAAFEDPAFYDQMERARQQARARFVIIIAVATMLRNIVTLLTMVATVVVYSPWLLALLGVAIVPVFFGESKFAFLNYSLLCRQTEAKREMDYIRYLGASSQSVKEVKIFGLGRYLSGRYRQIFDKFFKDNRALAIDHFIHCGSIGLIPSIAYFGTYAFIVTRAIGGTCTVGDLTLVTGAFARSRESMESLVNQFIILSEQALYAKDFFEFLGAKPSIVSGRRATPRLFRTGFELRNVGFAYPGSSKRVIHDISFTIVPGEKIALVGGNGAGKTTIAKLLARLYDPTEGQILLDGVDIREYKAEDVRREIGVLFQDYMRYDMTVRENIAMGKIDEISNDAMIVAAAEKSRAAGIIDGFERRYDQMLGRRFGGGVDLSIGQWQKVALARAYFRNCQILILDEPTASLDARSEFESYKRFMDLSKGKMSVIISHRFSTVRAADKIIVLNEGSIVEVGSHDKLVACGGMYAELFGLQAAGYR